MWKRPVEHVPERTTTHSGKRRGPRQHPVCRLKRTDSTKPLMPPAGSPRIATLPAPSSSNSALFYILKLSNHADYPSASGWATAGLTWQKSFNSYGKREHVRLWSQPTTVLGQPAWLSAYTRETSAALSVKNHNFIHHIDRNLDEGVNMLVRDLSLSGCVDSVLQLPRPQIDPRPLLIPPATTCAPMAT